MLRNVRPASNFSTRLISLLLCYGLFLSQLSFAIPQAAAFERGNVKFDVPTSKSGAKAKDFARGKLNMPGIGWLSTLLGYAGNSSIAPSPLPQQQSSSSTIVISQIYGGGGNSGSAYKNDFIELFNRSNTIVDLTNWSVQYAPATSSTWQVTTLSGSLGPGQYLLIQEALGSGGTINLPTPDVMGAISMNATAGKVALVNNSMPLGYNYPQNNPNIADFVGYGSSTGSYEGSGPTPSPSNANAVLRANNGCTDTDHNSTDFNVASANPRNSSFPVSVCGGGPPPSTTVVISEFRTRGLNGGYDEFVELYNMTEAAIDISGWKIDASNNTGGVSTRVTVRPGTTLPAHGHFLATNNIASGGFSGVMTGDQTYTAGIPDDGGIAIVKQDGTIVDRVGMSAGSAFKESRALGGFTTNSDQSYERRPGGGSGSSQDTDDNPSDFQTRAVSDPQNLNSPPASPNNQPPVANAGGPYTATASSPVQFDGSASSDPDGSVTSYEWNFGDGATGTGPTPTHAYASTGVYSATLTVADNNGTTHSSTANVNITSAGNQAPVANAGGPYAEQANSIIQFNGGASSDPDGSVMSYSWDFGDLTTATGATPSHVYESARTYQVTLTVADDMGATASTVVNVVISKDDDLNYIQAGAEDVGWDSGNAPSAGDFENGRGNASNRSEGNGNFQITAPVISLPGRGLDLNLNLYYNSRLWNKSGSEMAYDIDHDWPAPGWQLGFGKMVDMSAGGAMIIEGDGTRHGFTGTSSYERLTTSYGSADILTFKGQTTDGSFIEYRCERSGPPSGVARYPNGVVVFYYNHSPTYYSSGQNTSGRASNIYLYPTLIRDANGNFIQIKYEWDQREPRIQHIVDSLGRVINFHYNSDKLLTAITTKGLKDAGGNVTTRTLVRLHYKKLALNYAFASGLTPRVTNPSPWVIDAVYYPATSSGYWFGDADSYSSYGMIKKVVEQRGMGFSAATLTELGTITAGSMTKQQEYDYSPAADASLKSAPTFRTLTETWEGINTAPPITTYDVQNNPAPADHVVTVIRPDGTKHIQRSYNLSNLPDSDPNKYKDGLVYEEEVRDAGDRVLQKNRMNWEAGFNKTPRLTHTEVEDELQQVLATDYDQYGDYNAVGRVREYDYTGAVVRTTRTTYLSYVNNDLGRLLYPNSSVIAPRLINLVETERVYTGDDAANKLAFSKVNKYDEYTDPLKAYSANITANSDLYTFGEVRNSNSGILGHSGYFNPKPYPDGAGADYITKRGNLTSVVIYADPNNPAGPGNSTKKQTYDMTGNVITSSSACCEQTSSVYELNTQYAYPASTTRGPADQNSLLRITTSATYDFNTSLPLSTTDANGRITRNNYFTESWRMKEFILPTNATTTFEYDDAALKVTETTYNSPGGDVVGKNVKLLNGMGQVRREEALTTNDEWDIVETQYDLMGRVWKQSRPYASSGGPQWKETIYDDLGRIKELREPYASAEELAASGTRTRMVYNGERPQGASADPGQSVQTFDAWGRWRWARKDSSGRLAEIVEPNPDGGTGFVTRYSYDTLSNLAEVRQGAGQVRRFRHDALGRLTHQKLAEASATLNSEGERVSTGAESEQWSDVYVYDERSNMIAHIDARGVRTLFSYKDASGNDDPLNRLQGMTYDVSRVDTSSPTILPAADVRFEYRTKSSASQMVDVAQVSKVRAVGVSTEDYVYNPEGLLREKILTMVDRLNRPMTTTYEYDTLNRVRQITYPEQYQAGVETPARKVVKPNYDVAGRIDGIKVNDLSYASGIHYNSASQISKLIVGYGDNRVNEHYAYNPKSGLLVNQTVTRGADTLMELSYGYKESYCTGSNCAPVDEANMAYPYTGQVTKISGDSGEYNYSYDQLGRLKKADHQYGYIMHTSTTTGDGKGGLDTLWIWVQPYDTQNYSYDQYGNRTGVTSKGTVNRTPPKDGLESLAYDTLTNRITTPGFSYDAAGNQTQAGTGQIFIYDAAGRLAKVKDQSGTTVVSYKYGSSNQRLMTQHGDENSAQKTYFVWEGNSVITEYNETSALPSSPQWAKNYIYLDGRLLATEEPSGASGEITKYHHPDRVGTRLVTNSANTSYFKQENLAFGTALDSESSGSTNQRFTSYDRNNATGLDYAVNRYYDSRQGRFTQVDKLGMRAANLADPQSLNMYAYAGNDPVNRVDPDGNFSLGSIFGFIGALFRAFMPNRVNISYTYRNLPPVSVSFSTNFQSVYLGFAGAEWQVRGVSQRQSQNMTDFQNAADAARGILQGDNDCSRFFKGAGLSALNAITDFVASAGESVFQAMGNSRTGIGMEIPVTVNLAPITSPDAYAAVAPISVTINTNGPFVRRIALSNQPLPRFGNYDPGRLRSRVLQLLHEVGHLVITGDSIAFVRAGNRLFQVRRLHHLLPLDGNNSNQQLSEENTDRIMAACSAEINALRQ